MFNRVCLASSSGSVALLSVLAFSVSGVADEQEGQVHGIVLVELFTSQGCSSCPSADVNLKRLTDVASKDKLPVYTLSLHVDYWNQLGWNDPFSSAEATERQRRYASVFNSRRVYTPQMVVNGSVEFVGSDQKRSTQVVQEMLESKTAVTIAGTADFGLKDIKVSWTTIGSAGDDIINIAIVQNDGENQVPRGENSGRKLQHTNIVRQFKTFTKDLAAGTATFSIPDEFNASGYHAVVFVQSNSTGTVRGAARLNLTSGK